jgi:hypothetical protein
MNLLSNAAKALGLTAALWLGLAAQSASAAPSGTWTGTYSGSDHGTVTISIDAYQAVTCDFKSAGGADHKMTGGVNYASGDFFGFECESPLTGTDLWLVTGSSNDNGVTLGGSWSSGNATNGTSGTGTFTTTASSGGGGGATSSVDGIYAMTNADGSPGDYVSVHTNGSTMIAAVYRSADPAHGPSFALTDGGVDVAALYKWGSWDLYNGSLSGSNASLSGYAQNGGCKATLTLSFNGSGGTARVALNGVSDLVASGAKPSCSGTGATLAMQKIF